MLFCYSNIYMNLIISKIRSIELIANTVLVIHLVVLIYYYVREYIFRFKNLPCTEFKIHSKFNAFCRLSYEMNQFSFWICEWMEEKRFGLDAFRKFVQEWLISDGINCSYFSYLIRGNQKVSIEFWKPKNYFRFYFEFRIFDLSNCFWISLSFVHKLRDVCAIEAG